MRFICIFRGKRIVVEYLKLSVELDTNRERRQKLKEQKSGRVLQIDRIKELKEYLQGKNTAVVKFDGELFGRLIVKL